MASPLRRTRQSGAAFAGGAALHPLAGRQLLRRLRAPVCLSDGPRDASSPTPSNPPSPASAPSSRATPARPSRPSAAAAAPSADTADIVGANSLGESLRTSPRLNSWRMNAMRDYFGDDGREVEKYTKRCRSLRGRPMFRVLLVGSGARELSVAERLAASDAVAAVYYCPDEAGACALALAPFATSTGVCAQREPAELVRFARWALVDAVFVGPDRPDAIGRETEKALAEAGVTLFPHDVSAAVAQGEIAPEDCLAALAESVEPPTAEQLVE